MRLTPLPFALSLLISCLGAGCAATVADPDENLFDVLGTELTRSQRKARVESIRDRSATHGFDNFWLLAGIAKCETQLAHCWSEATWACRGPASASCGGGPVIAGSGDGACSRRRGGLGIFQFDAGNYDDTIRREGPGILTLDGNIDGAVAFTTAMVVRSRFISGVSTDAEALEWMSRIRPGSAGYSEWIDTVTGYYNGCMRGSCSIYASRAARYRGCHQDVLDEMGESFFFDAAPATPTASCGDGTCDTSESCSGCAADCGACPASCGDGTCDTSESCSGCATDCGACAASCGDGTCNSGESCSSCATDCGACAASCGDGTCNSGESCSSCASDCGACAPRCGDGTCNSGESCSSCAADCGACAPRCGDGTCNSGESCSSCASDCGACTVTSCSVAGHMSTTNGGSCSSPEAWRCVFSPSLGANVSQVCRSGSWLNFHVDPRGCGDCCGSYSTSCRQSGA